MDPFILVKFMKPVEPKEAAVSLLIFEWNDESLIGAYPDPDMFHVRILLVVLLMAHC